ncbi:MAG: membrane dipeptidase [Rikenellaceae bacterium]|nr:membrane dipeptidase [Rikenellaceae bacterium]
MDRLFTDFNTAVSGVEPRSRIHRPVIGLSVNIADEASRLHEAYIRSVADAGGIPLLIPASTDINILRHAVECIDGLILTGGADVGGEYFGEDTHTTADVDPLRDAYDFLLLRLASDRQLPIFGICRGVQVINIGFGGDIWQDIPAQYPIQQTLTHSLQIPREKPVHPVTIAENSLLKSIFGKSSVEVNSRHHQAIRKIADGFKVSAVSPDGIIEAIEGYPFRRIFGVQWHPENMASEGGSDEMKRLFEFFISEASLFKQAKDIHNKYLTLDSHCDTPMLFADRQVNIGLRSDIAQADLVKMEEGRIDAVFMAAYIPQGLRDDASHDRSMEQALELLDEVKRQIAVNADHAGLAVTFEDAYRLKDENKRAVFLGIENGYAIGSDIDKLTIFRDMGVVYMTLCHNGANDLCDSAVGDAEYGGLSPLGRDAVAEMNRLGMVIDLSHAAETTFYDVLEESSAPVICSHSSARTLCDHPRNLTDDQIRAIADKGGVVQICLYSGFLAKRRPATIMDAVDHIDHVVALVGANHVGIGSDFDGGGGIEGCGGSNELINITMELLRREYAEEDIAKILGGSLRRVVDEVQRLRIK